MRKLLMLIATLILILTALTELTLPLILTSMLRTQLAALTPSQIVELEINFTPRLLLITGQINSIKAEVVDAKFGDFKCSALTLEAENVKVDIPKLLFAVKDAAPYLNPVGKTKITCALSEDNLKFFLQSKFSQLENLQLKITETQITATSNASILGRNSDLELSGTILVEDSALYFHITKLNAKNALLRHVHLDKFFGDVKIVDSAKLPLNLKFETVELKAGQVLITAAR